MKKLLPLTLVTAALAATAGAAPIISAQSIIVNPVQTAVNVRVWTDRDSSGNQTPNYVPGERIRLYTSVNQDAYVYLFNVDPQGQVDLILPNRYAGGANFLKANTTKVFPDAQDGFTFDIAAPYGLNKVLAVASRTPLNLDQIATFKSGQNSFATVNVQGQQQLAQALSIVVNPVPQESWTSDTAYYNVAQPAVATPVRPVPVQPVRPAPVRPVPTQPSLPWLNDRNWNYEFQRSDSLAQVHETYAAQLRSQGYQLVNIRQKGNEIRSDWRRGRDTARLEVKQRGGRFAVEIERR
ncbi:DUF4384 domain-containing protein [Deinococcus sp. Leaf326]|jgi:hypothetical protein|uniref:DUF4384 domain-containing protein n=1 Tax=Deinococcus sp. Leaf326 TaxID=1736338 RepID=UPI0006F70A8A|nr:DUF4384 domain-containing protein [Deinococcus sp. Leaf326]KQR08866.1 S-layer protein [Deinococcus sp. Leaf326]